MTISTIRTPKGKMIHALRDDAMQVNDSTIMGEVLCGPEYKGIAGMVETPEGVTCPKCHARLMAELAAELAEVQAQMAMYGEPTVLGTPETIAEPDMRRERYMTEGRKRHGRIIQERAAKRRAMKAMVRNV